MPLQPFTDPRDWTDGEFVNEAIMDTHIKGNFNAMGPRFIARKASDQSVASSTAFVSDTALTMPVAINESWLFRFLLRWDASIAGDIKISFSLPSGQIDAVPFPVATTANAFQDVMWQSLTTTDGQPNSFGASGTGLVRIMAIEGVYTGGVTAGSVTLRWAQNISDATATRVLTNSTLWGVRLSP